MELTDLQKRLDVFLQGEDARLEEELETAQAEKDRKRYYDILLQMIEMIFRLSSSDDVILIDPARRL